MCVILNKYYELAGLKHIKNILIISDGDGKMSNQEFTSGFTFVSPNKIR